MIRYSSVSLMWAGRCGSCHVKITRHCHVKIIIHCHVKITLHCQMSSRQPASAKLPITSAKLPLPTMKLQQSTAKLRLPIIKLQQPIAKLSLPTIKYVITLCCKCSPPGGCVDWSVWESCPCLASTRLLPQYASTDLHRQESQVVF